MSVHDYFKESKVDLKGLSKYFDDLKSEARVAEARSLTAKEQAALFDAAKGFKPLTIDDFVPPSHQAFKPVIHYGKNSLPLFSIFEKRFCRPDNDHNKKELWGYNEQAMKFFTGPGYFIARQHNGEEVVIDYYEVPSRKPESWPTILPNSAKLSRFVYFHTRDYMRGVSKHVSIGKASKNDKPMNNWFVLCREEI